MVLTPISRLDPDTQQQALALNSESLVLGLSMCFVCLSKSVLTQQVLGTTLGAMNVCDTDDAV